MFLRNSWYVFGWSRDCAGDGRPTGKVIIGDPVMVWRDGDGTLHAMEDRCPHRHAPLSMGRVEGSTLRCLYHGMTFAADGRCIGMPLLDSPPDVKVRTYPVIERDDWVWVWMGDPDQADPGLIPHAFGIGDPARPMQAHSIDYDAHYQLIHDNLCDLSHLDFVHAGTLKPATGANWSESAPRILPSGRSLRFERWFEGVDMPGSPGTRVDTWSAYEFSVPGIFVMHGARYAEGTAARFGRKAPEGIAPIVENIEQQAVTPISDRRSAYHYATGLVGNSPAMTAALAKRMDVVMAAFQEDKAIIEAQQRIWDLTDLSAPKHFLPQDKGPFLMRQLIDRLIRAEQQPAPGPDAG